MPLVPIPVAFDNLRLHLGGGSAATDDDRDVHRLIRHVGDIDRIRDAELRLHRLIDYVPVRVIGIVPETESDLVMVVALGIEIGSDILSEHKAINDRPLGGIVRGTVDIVALYLDVGAVCFLVLVPG